MSFTPSRRVDGVLKTDTYSPSSSMKTVSVSGRVPMLLSMSKYCVISSKSTTSLELAPLICSFVGRLDAFYTAGHGFLSGSRRGHQGRL